MNIVVCVKYVPDATADRHFESDGTVDRVGVPGLLSELDEYAVEQALQRVVATLQVADRVCRHQCRVRGTARVNGSIGASNSVPSSASIR